MDEVDRLNYRECAAFAIKLSVEEALINAIKHGNRYDPKKKVRIEATITPAQAEITIEDEGAGFNRAAVPDPRADENLHRLHGRGILLMEAYMSEVQWTRGGRRVRLVRKNDDAPLTSA
jgi:serine/threonine-protein kinase RsbW